MSTIAKPASARQQQPVAPRIPIHTFTLVFVSEGGAAAAILDMSGIEDQALARFLAYLVLPDCTFKVLDGDQSHKFMGGAFCYYSFSPMGGSFTQPTQPQAKEARA